MRKLLVLPLLLLFLFVPQAQADTWSDQQEALSVTINKEGPKMVRSLESVLDVYIESNGTIYWNDTKVQEPYKIYLSALQNFNKTVDDMWAVHSRARTSYEKTFQRKSKRGKRCITKAKRLRNGARASFWSLTGQMKNALSGREVLVSKSVDIANKVFQGSTSSTDGYIDGAIYDFGTDHMIAPPPGAGERMDPDPVGELSDEVFENMSIVDPLFYSEFGSLYQKSIRTLQKCKKLKR